MDTFTKHAGLGVNAGSSGESLLGIWNGREDSPQLPHAKTASEALRGFLAATAEDERRYSFTPEGRRESRARRAKPALSKLVDALRDIRSTHRADLKRAATETESALAELAPPYRAEPWQASFDVELGRQLRRNPSLRGLLVAAAEAGEVRGDLKPYLAAAVRLPLPLTGLDADAQNKIASAATGGVDLYVQAGAEAADALRIVRGAATRIKNEAELPPAALQSASMELCNLVMTGNLEGGWTRLPADAVNAEALRGVSHPDAAPLLQEQE